MKISGFVKKVLFIGLTILSDCTNANSLNAISMSYISMNNQECKTRPQVVNVNGDEPEFFPFFYNCFFWKQVNVMVVVIILTIHMQHFVFLML